MSRQRSWHAHLRRIALGCFLLLGVATTAFAQFDRGTISGSSRTRRVASFRAQPSRRRARRRSSPTPPSPTVAASTHFQT